MSQIQKALDVADQGLDASLERLFEFLRIPSISADSAYDGDCRKAAEWAAAALRELGFDASTRKTIGHPMVVGHWRTGKAGVPHVLFYGHYDVQPPDPVDLWTSKSKRPTNNLAHPRARPAGRCPRPEARASTKMAAG